MSLLITTHDSSHEFFESKLQDDVIIVNVRVVYVMSPICEKFVRLWRIRMVYTKPLQWHI